MLGTMALCAAVFAPALAEVEPLKDDDCACEFDKVFWIPNKLPKLYEFDCEFDCEEDDEPWPVAEAVAPV